MSTAVASVAFFLSGFAALAYQIVWQRLLVLPVGADVYATTVVIGGFMAGLGAGSLAGGHVADRLTRRQCLWAFAVAEVLVAAFGFGSRPLLYDLFYLRVAPGVGGTAASIIGFASLLWPTFWMGVSLPLLGRAVTARVDGAARHAGMLYGLNTLGAATGAFATTWLILPRLGLAGTPRLAALLNCAAALCGALLAMSPAAAGHSHVRGALAKPESYLAPPPARARSEWSWIALYALAGFMALSLEVVWFRLLAVMVKSSAFTFGTLLTVYLGGLGAGAAATSMVLHRVRRPARAFLLCQAFIGLYSGVSVMLLIALLPGSHALAPFWTYFGGSEPLDAVGAFMSVFRGGAGRADFLRLYVALPLVLFGPPTAAMGASFPLLQRVVQNDLTHVGRRIGLLLVANIAGSTAGSILTGWLALNTIGSAGVLMLVTLVGSLFLALAVRDIAGPGVALRAAAAPAVLALGLMLALRLPHGGQLWATFHGSSREYTAVSEDASGVALIKAAPSSLGRTNAGVFIEGIGQSWIPFGGIHSALGALPAFLHAGPRTAAVIGLGSGDTVYALAGRDSLTRIVCAEIVRPQLPTLVEWSRRTGYPALRSLLSDPRIEMRLGDGRAFLMRSAERFDIIEADALRPSSAYSGNVYSVGYFQLLRSRLAPGGIAVTWAPTSRVRETFLAVFPYVMSFGPIIIGSDAPVPFSADDVRARIAAPSAREHFRNAGIELDDVLAPYLAVAPVLTTPDAPRRADNLNEDLFPRDEFGVE